MTVIVVSDEQEAAFANAALLLAKDEAYEEAAGFVIRALSDDAKGLAEEIKKLQGFPTDVVDWVRTLDAFNVVLKYYGGETVEVSHP